MLEVIGVDEGDDDAVTVVDDDADVAMEDIMESV